MADEPSNPAAEAPNGLQRIDAAIARIDAAILARNNTNEALTRRHAALKTRMAEAVAALDDVIARGAAG